MIDFAALQAPFPPHQVSWRPRRSGRSENGIWLRAVPYVEARWVHQRLDDVLGPANWRTLHELKDNALLVGLALRDPETGEWVTKWEGTGLMAATQGHDGLSEEDARKATFTVGFRRAAAMWGIGRPLLFVESLPATCHADSRQGQHWAKLDDSTEFSWDPPTLPPWALPGGAGVPPEGPARPTRPATDRANGRRARPDPKSQADDTAPIPCPRCESEVWDNRARKPANRATAADLRCKRWRECGWAVTLEGWETSIQDRVGKLQKQGTVTAGDAARAIAAAGTRDPEKLHAVECWLAEEEKGVESHA